jgi:hypothetical protein
MLLNKAGSTYLVFWQIVLSLAIFHVMRIEAATRIAIELNVKSHDSDRDIEIMAKTLADDYGFKLVEQVGHLRGIYEFELPYSASYQKSDDERLKFRMKRLDEDKTIRWYEEQVPRWRYKRSIDEDDIELVNMPRQHDHTTKLTFSDPYYKRQWYLHGPNSINVLPVWNSGITGKGVNVAVLDDGLFSEHVDLAPNYVRSLFKVVFFIFYLISQFLFYRML